MSAEYCSVCGAHCFQSVCGVCLLADWRARAEAAEAQLEEAREVLLSVRTYGGRCVSCYRDPCAPDCRLAAVLRDDF